MDIVAQHDKDGARYRISGTLSFRDRDAFAPVITTAGEGSNRIIGLDLHGLTRIDSFGIGLFLVAHEAAQAAGNRLVIENVEGDVARVFHLANLDAVLSLRQFRPEPAARLAPRPANGRLAAAMQPVSADGRDTFVLTGRFTFADRDLFEELMPALLACAGPRIMLHMAEVDFLDSAGLSMVLIAQEECEKRGLKLEIGAPSPRVAQLFRLSALDHMLVDGP